MFRIDEITYIDDSLVTCSEYQLFIDEMMARRKYFQPDHWNSYRFPTGHARKTLLGVRLGDAKTFCEWLTQRDVGIWRYRLPTHEEASNYPIIKDPNQVPLGYWTVENDGQAQCAWIGHVPTDPRGVSGDFSPDIQDELNRAFVRARIRGLILNHEFVQSLELLRPGIFGGELGRLLAHARHRATAFDSDFTLALNRELGVEMDDNSTSVFDFTRGLDIAFVIDHDIDCTVARRHALSLASDLARTRDAATKISPSIAHDINNILDCTLDLFVDILTLQERLIARSPIFEGIRIVKERVK